MLLQKLITKNNKFLCIIFCIITILSCVGCGKITDETANIESLNWEVIAEIQEWKTCDESGWEVPEGAIVYKEQEEVKSYTIVGYQTKYKTEEYQELVGYILPTWRPRYETRTKKVSYKEAITKPVYATKYYYTIERWVHLKNVVLASGHDKNYNYKEYICNENERVNNIEYRYYVKLEGDNIHVSHIADKDTWEALYVGQEMPITKNQYGTMTIDWDKFNAAN